MRGVFWCVKNGFTSDIHEVSGEMSHLHPRCVVTRFMANKAKTTFTD